MTSNDLAPARRLRPRLAALSLLAAFLRSVPGAAQEKDKDSVQLKDGKSESGLIKSEEYSGLQFVPSRGPARTIEWKDVASLTYAGSTEFTIAKEALDG